MTAEPVARSGAEEVRCPSGALNFKIIDGDRIEIKCDHWQCTGRDHVVLHRYSIPDGELLETLKFKNPARGRRAQNHRKEVP